MMRGWILPLLMASLALAGCLNGNTDDGASTQLLTFPGDWSEQALAFAGNHNHANATQHAGLSTPNFNILGHDPLFSPHYGTTPYGYLCGDAATTIDGRRLAVVESRSDVGFAIADVTDPIAPQWLGELIMPRTYVYDLAVVPDGRHAVLVTADTKNTVPTLPVADARGPRQAGPAQLQIGSTPDTENGRTPEMLWRTPCAPEGRAMRWAVTEDPVPRPYSLLLIDISDPSEPAVVDQRPLLGYGHSVFARQQDGRTLLLVSAVGNPNVQNWQFYDLVTTPNGAVLQHLSTYTGPTHQDLDPGMLGGHTDGWFHTHPNGQSLAYLVGAGDFLIVDIENPRAPELVGRWTDRVPGRSGPVANMHSVYPMPTLDDAGRHYTIVGPEFGGHPDGQPSGNVWVLDTTDPRNPNEVGAWTLPHEVDWNGTYMFSNHYLTAHDKTIFVSMYHGGVWALDMSGVAPNTFTLLPSVGVFLPTESVPNPPSRGYRWSPTLEEVLVFEDGSLVTFDSMTGLYTFEFDASNPAPSPTPWPVEPVS